MRTNLKHKNDLILFYPKQHLITLLIEDECTPDAYITFEASFYRKTGLSVEEFERLAIKFETDDCFVFKLNFYYLEISADDPRYKLRVANV